MEIQEVPKQASDPFQGDEMARNATRELKDYILYLEKKYNRHFTLMGFSVGFVDPQNEPKRNDNGEGQVDSGTTTG